MGELDGKVALITGGGRGQGRSHALALAELGADVVVCDIAANVPTVQYDLASPADLDETVALVQKLGRRAISIVADMRVTADVNRVVEQAISEFGQIDILVANHGVLGYGTVESLSDEEWETLIDTNLTGVFKTIRAVVPHMRARGYGRIVVTASSAARRPNANMPHYVASKWAVVGLMKATACDLAGTGITVNAVAPVGVGTAMIFNEETYRIFCPDIEAPTREDFLARSRTAFRSSYLEPEAVSRSVLYLVLDHQGVLNGQVCDISAGQSAGLPV